MLPNIKQIIDLVLDDLAARQAGRQAGKQASNPIGFECRVGVISILFAKNIKNTKLFKTNKKNENRKFKK